MFSIIKKYKRNLNNICKIREKGVSLISLIVIIIVLLILAGVTIKISSGDSGLIKKTKKGVAMYQNASVNESETLNEYARKLKTFVEVPKAETIEFKADITGWTTKDVTMTATSDDPDYEIELKSEDSDWSVRKDNKITVSKNQQINARLKNLVDKYSEDVATYNVTNIDKDAPDKTAPALKATTNSITVTFKQKDDGSGIAKREYSIDNGATWKAGDSVFTFSGLTQGKKYEIITRATDRVENQSISDVSYITTETIPTPVRGSNITFTATPTTKTSGNVTVTVSTTVTGYTLQTSTDGTTWGTTNPLIFSQNGTAYARLWDGNNASAVATFNITNIETDPLKNTDRTIDDLNADGGDSNKDGVVDTKDDLRGFYIDLNNDGNLDTTNDGVIYGDLLTGGEGLYFCHTLEGIDTIDDDCKYKIPTKSTLSSYEIIKDSNGKIKKFDGPFGSRGMLQRKTAVTNGDRFYVLALADFDSNTHCWYNKATNMTDYATYTSTSFGSGKENTSKMITAWNNKKYGEQIGNSSYPDVWGVIQDKANAGWFVPSRDEWNAFGAFFKVGGEWSSVFGAEPDDKDTFTDYYDYNKVYKLSNWCWSSSQYDTNRAYNVNFNYGNFISFIVYDTRGRVRLGSTF